MEKVSRLQLGVREADVRVALLQAEGVARAAVLDQYRMERPHHAAALQPAAGSANSRDMALYWAAQSHSLPHNALRDLLRVRQSALHVEGQLADRLLASLPLEGSVGEGSASPRSPTHVMVEQRTLLHNEGCRLQAATTMLQSVQS